MIGLCATCRHWERNDPADDYALNEDEGETPRLPFSAPAYGVCNLGRTRNGAPLVATLAAALDAEQYAARLGTHETFGCIQWERTT